MKIIVTGGSGFIGHNLVVYLLSKGHQVLNIDIKSPPDRSYDGFWHKADLVDSEQYHTQFVQFSPDYVFHLAARTDLKGTHISEYEVNTQGVNDLLEVCAGSLSIKRVIIASSMLVCKAGYIPSDENDYAPDTVYGESKVITERIVKSSVLAPTDWVLVRPTSIWGPWFSVPYRTFFDILLAGKYFRIGEKSSTKTFGYIGNVVQQLEALMYADESVCSKKTFYLGDSPLNVDAWALEIAQIAGIKEPLRVPFILLKFAACIGDFLALFKINFPLTSFRLKNMTTNNVIDTTPIQSIISVPAITLQQGIRETLVWIKNNSK